MCLCLVFEQSLIRKLPSPFSHRNWKRKRGRERRRGRSWSGIARRETRSARRNGNDGIASGRRTESGSARERGSVREREIETVSARKSVTGRESEAVTAAKTAVDPENRVAIETEIRRRSVIVRKMRKRRTNGVNWRGSCERKRRRIRSV